MNRKQDKDSTFRDLPPLREEYASAEGASEASWLSRDARMLHIRQLAEKLSRVDVPVLITGESGTGKEVMSRFIHERSLRRSRPFIAVNCAAIPSELVESELFGFEKGAFSGAHALKPGAFELADQGTLFLDEIGEMPLQIQSKLLRAVEHHRFRRIGGKNEVKVDIRIIAATNQAVREKIRAREFREDLFYRLSVAEIELPPLRDRLEDISFLAEYFLQKFSRKYRKSGIRFTEHVTAQYARYGWPGNVRELRNVIERAVLFTEGQQIQQSFLPDEETRERVNGVSSNGTSAPPVGGLRFIDFTGDYLKDEDSSQHGKPKSEVKAGGDGSMGNVRNSWSTGYTERFGNGHLENSKPAPFVSLPVGASLEEAEQLLIQETLASVGNNKSEAARILGCSRKTLHNKLSRSG